MFNIKLTFAKSLQGMRPEGRWMDTSMGKFDLHPQPSAPSCVHPLTYGWEPDDGRLLNMEMYCTSSRDFLSHGCTVFFFSKVLLCEGDAVFIFVGKNVYYHSCTRAVAYTRFYFIIFVADFQKWWKCRRICILATIRSFTRKVVYKQCGLVYPGKHVQKMYSSVGIAYPCISLYKCTSTVFDLWCQASTYLIFSFLFCILNALLHVKFSRSKCISNHACFIP